MLQNSGSGWNKIPEIDKNGNLVWKPCMSTIKMHLNQVSPYRVTLDDMMEMFTFSNRRRELFDGFIRYRTELFKIGVINGIQWIGGSFIGFFKQEPRDIDVATLIMIEDERQEEFIRKIRCEYRLLHDRHHVKCEYGVDPIYIHHYSKLKQWSENKYIRSLQLLHTLYSNDEDTGERRGYIEIDLMGSKNHKTDKHQSLY